MRESDEYQQSAVDRMLRPSRTRAGLGDLTESKKAERGEFVQESGSIIPAEMPTQTAPMAPKVESGVQPIYNTLPANAGRFAFGQLTNIAIGGESGLLTKTIFTKQVPYGRVLVVNEFQVNVEDVLNGATSLGIPTNTFDISIYLNGQVEVFNQGITIQALDGYYPCYLIAGPADIVTVTATFNFDSVGTYTNAIFLTHLRGDMLLPNELATPYTGLRQTAAPVFIVPKG